MHTSQRFLFSCYIRWNLPGGKLNDSYISNSLILFLTLMAVPPQRHHWLLCQFSFFLLWPGFELRASQFKAGTVQSRHSSTWATSPVPFCSGYLGDKVPWTICLGRPWAMILPMSVSQVAGITAVGHWCLLSGLKISFLIHYWVPNFIKCPLLFMRQGLLL
jgi:hypothetical protein